MNAEIFAEWLRRQGHSVVKTTSSYWFDAAPRVYQAFPYHWVIKPPDEELLNLLREKRALALRYSTTADNPVGCISYHTVCDQHNYTLNELHSGSRQNVRKGLNNCSIEQLSFEYIAKKGWLLEKDTASRQGRNTTLSEEQWHHRYMAAADLPGFEAWGALVDDQLAAALLVVQIDNCYEIISQQSLRNYLKTRVNHALTFAVTQKIMNRDGTRFIHYGVQSLDAPESVDEYKILLGYKAKPVRQRVVFHPLATPFFNKFTYEVVRWMRSGMHKNAFLRKLEGILRFYLNGKLPSAEQVLPECLMDRKFELIEAMNLHKKAPNKPAN